MICMKRIIKNILVIIYPIILFYIVSLLSNYYNYAFISYNFLPNKRVFTFLAFIFLLNISIIYNKHIKLLSLDINYLYKLHLLLDSIWCFLFFLYHEYFISLIVIIFSIITLFLLTFNLYKFRKMLLLYLLFYIMWHIYIVIINILIL